MIASYLVLKWFYWTCRHVTKLCSIVDEPFAGISVALVVIVQHLVAAVARRECGQQCDQHVCSQQSVSE